MRLINASTLEQLEFFDSRLPKYAILSHTWGDDEVSLQDFQAGRGRTGHGWSKIVDCCHLARAKGLEWIWCDTCCIDKSSSAELSEAINSMFRWYQNSEVCLVFLDDYDASDKTVSLRKCRWFTRAWTLQELLAPRDAEFYDAMRRCIGTRLSLAQELSACTGIRERLLLQGMSFEAPLYRNLGQYEEYIKPKMPCVAERMFWASRRVATRGEDVAYCLIGLFGISMPLLYGEGKVKAFARLQEHIIAQTNDETIFAWTSQLGDSRGILALSPGEFAKSGDVRRVAFAVSRPPSLIASYALDLSVPNDLSLGNFLRDWGLPPLSTTIRVPIAAVTQPSSLEQIVVVLRRPAVDKALWVRMPSANHSTQSLSVASGWCGAGLRLPPFRRISVALSDTTNANDVDKLELSPRWVSLTVSAGVVIAAGLGLAFLVLIAVFLSLLLEFRKGNLIAWHLPTLWCFMYFVGFIAHYWSLYKESLTTLLLPAIVLLSVQSYALVIYVAASVIAIWALQVFLVLRDESWGRRNVRTTFVELHTLQAWYIMD